MLPAPNRLRLNREFQRVYRHGRSWAHPLLALHVLQRPSGKRAGISVSKKVGKAVQRNGVRRRLREVLRARLPHWKDGFDVILVARAPAAAAEFGALGGAVEELARRARLAREPEAPSDTPFIMPSGGRARPERPRGENARPAG
jgi:ribonuclease P protein component